MKKVISKKKNILSNYVDIYNYVKRHRLIPSTSFDHLFTYDLNLFTVDSDFNLQEEEVTVDKILYALGSIKRIFAKPFIDLIDVDNVLPVESIRKIFSKTISHAINHVNTIADIYDDGSVKPQKLMSVEYKLLYQTYENQIFTFLINLLLKYCHKNILILNNYLFMDGEMLNVNVLERLHHMFYYVAIGKLHTGYIRNFTDKYEDIRRLNKKLLKINDAITSRLNSRVYRENAKLVRKTKKYKLKKTNIFRSQKDYKKVYNLMRYFISQDVNVETYIDEDDRIKLLDYYFLYLENLIIFSLLHFNFDFVKKCKVNLNNMDTNFKFKKFKINIKKKCVKDVNYIVLTFKKDTTFKLGLIPLVKSYRRSHYSAVIKSRKDADIYFYVSPLIDTNAEIYLSINNVDSFRRVQQLILGGMIYSDKTHDTCPFCGSKMVKVGMGKTASYECDLCKTVIKKITCPNTKRVYYTTEIKNYSQYVNTAVYKAEMSKQKLRNLKQNEMFYRNIVELDSELHNVCPYCGEDHDY